MFAGILKTSLLMADRSKFLLRLFVQLLHKRQRSPLKTGVKVIY